MFVNYSIWLKDREQMHVSRGVSPFITKAGVSPIMKAGVSPFIMKADVSPILYIERRALKWCISVSYPS
jgi:hypothetical protein